MKKFRYIYTIHRTELKEFKIPIDTESDDETSTDIYAEAKAIAIADQLHYNGRGKIVFEELQPIHREKQEINE